MKRKSNLPISTVLDVYNNKISIEFLNRNQELIKNISLVSPSLYEMFIREFSTGEISKKTNFSIMKYIIRMSSRTATFQTFGSVSDENVESEFLSVRLSLKWLIRLKNSVELKQKKESNLVFYVNPELYDKGKYYRMNNYDKTSNKLKEVIIFKESLTGRIIEILKSERIEYCKIFNKVLEKVGNNKLTHKILLNLIKNNCLTSELNFSGFNPKCTEILYKISKYMDFEDKINTEIIINMLKDLKKIDNLSNNNLMKINRLKEYMNKLLSIEDDIIVDRYFKNKDAINDNNNNWEDLHLLRKFNCLTYGYQFIKSFEKLFLDKYGFYNEISLLNVIEDEIFSEKKIDAEVKKNQAYQKMKEDYEKNVSRLIIEYSLNNKIIPLLEISKLFEVEKNILKYYKIDIDIKYKDIFEKKYVSSDAIVFPAGSFSSKYEFLKNDKKLGDPFYRFDYILNYAPDIGVNYNKEDNNISIRDNYISEDIVIGIDHDGIYIKSIKKNKKIIPIYQSLAKLDFVAESYLARFLRRISEYICLPPKHYLTEKYLNFPHIPRIEHNGIILFKESWNMSIDSKDENILKSYIKDFMNNYKVPNNVAILESGNEFPVLVNTELGFKILINQLKKSRNVTLVEYPELYCEDYMVEFVDTVTQGDIVYSDVVEEKLQHCNRVSNDYITYILILQTTHIENEVLHKIFSFLTKRNYKFFFVRYVEEGERSLRVRIRRTMELDEFELFKFFQKMFTDNILKKYYTANYKPEYNRYGLNEMKLAEEIFELDSILAIENLYKFKNKDKHIIYIILSTLVNNYGDIISCLEYLERNFIESDNNKIIKSTYSKNRGYYDDIYSTFENNQIKNLFPKLSKKINNYFFNIRNNYSQKKCDYMVRSIIHMRINRNIGIIAEEYRYFYYAKYILKRKVFIDKFKGK